YWVIVQREFRNFKTFFVRSIQLVQPTTKTGNLHYTGFQSACLPDFVPEKDTYSPGEFALLPNYPNPFNPSTTITFQIASSEYVVIKVFDILGREMQTLLSEGQTPGIHSIVFKASAEMSSGIYYCRMTAGSFRTTRRMVLTR
ncbi:MAG TPA: T9SS type A sorting domain-containing protein, partial [Bacteroidota bacterium]|nr:T9SS type A sorting domain-containing protein [Bacteroidota bacterium]